MPYKFFKDVAIADVAFEASGRNLKELFESAGLAVTNTMVRDLKKVKPKVTKIFRIKSDTLENLLYNFLHEIVFLKDAKLLLFSKYSVKIDEKNFSLVAKASGEELKKKGNKWIARVILDV